MKARLWKEGRALFPYWAAAILLSFLWVPMARAGLRELWMLLAGLGYSLLGAAVFGHEYAHRTLPVLLSQPLSRRRVWYEKMGVLGTALFMLTAVNLIVPFFMIPDAMIPDWIQTPPVFVFLLLGLPVFVWLTSPALTLLLKNTLAAMLFAPLVPIALGGILWLLATLLIPDPTAELSVSEAAVTYFVVPAGIYAAALYLVGCYQFAGLESRESQPGDLEFPWFKLPASWAGRRVENVRISPWVSLIGKELHLQKLSFVLALILIATCLSLAGYRRLHPDGDAPFFYWAPFLVYWLIAPITIGAISIAEEHQLGLLEWQLTLPPARWKQWAIKLTVTFFTAAVLLAALPAAILAWLYEPMRISLDEGWWLAAGACLGVFGLLTLAIFASSLSTHTLRATLATVGILAGSTAVMYLAPSFLPGPLGDVRRFLWEMAASPQGLLIAGIVPFAAGMATITAPLGYGLLVGGFVLLLMVIALALSRANYLANDAHRPWVWLQWAVVVASTGLLFTLVDTIIQGINNLQVRGLAG